MDRQRRILTALLKLPENKKCFDCPSKVNVYANLFNSTFICEKCSGLHRELNHRVKSISASTFTPEEVSGLQKGGNAVAKRIWLATWSWREYPEPDAHEVDDVRQFMKAKYVKKLWYQDPNGGSNGVMPIEATASQRSSIVSTSSSAANSHNGALAVPDRVRAISKSQSFDNLYSVSNSNNNSSITPSGPGSVVPERTLSRKSSTISSDSGSTTISKSTDASSAGSSPFSPAATKHHQQQQQQQHRPQASFDAFSSAVGSPASSISTYTSVLGGHISAGTPAAIESADPFSLMNNAFSRMGVDSNSHLLSTTNGSVSAAQGASTNTIGRSQFSQTSSAPTSNDFFATFSSGSSMGGAQSSHAQGVSSAIESSDPFSLASSQTLRRPQQQHSQPSVNQDQSLGSLHGLDFNNSRSFASQPTTVGSATAAKSFDDYLSAFGQGQQQQQQTSLSSSALNTGIYGSPSSLSPTPNFSPTSLSPQSTGGSSNPFGMKQQPPSLQRAFTSDYPLTSNASSGQQQSNPFAVFAKQHTHPASHMQSAMSDPFGNASRALQQQQQQHNQLQSQDYFSTPGLGSQNSLSPNPFAMTMSPGVQSTFDQQQQQYQQQQQQQQRHQPAFLRSASESSHNFQQNMFHGSTYENASSMPGAPSRSMTVPAPAPTQVQAGGSNNLNDMFGQWMKPLPATATTKYPSIDDLDPFSTSSSAATPAYSNPFSLHM
ncbi:ArfGAP with FG repeats 1 [Mortierella sp. GBA30]|nr:ArfGAP with FG repeats 1 [Mortierella sp. GBA30]